ncbi:hypothetical protein CYMTET_40587 [Cymbomonas tetramitiformis]|uniref:Uncharacterized protein n=1 Tax=Cymbomonas tetramitiformis TaxID=36881 RepID=A0AAE0C9U3_9CHLO|nr:hypothetical protein CYMTET_40587 [Cymbomonas tetramitiformis]
MCLGAQDLTPVSSQRVPVKKRALQEEVRSRRGAWHAGGAGNEVLQWIACGAKMRRWLKDPPLKFDHGGTGMTKKPRVASLSCPKARDEQVEAGHGLPVVDLISHEVELQGGDDEEAAEASQGD